MKRSKSYRQADEQIDRSKFYSPAEAVALAKSEKVTKFDPTVEVALRLGVDPRKQDQMVRGTVNLPNGTGKTARVLVFATGDRAEEARAAGADLADPRGEALRRRPGGGDRPHPRRGQGPVPEEGPLPPHEGPRHPGRPQQAPQLPGGHGRSPGLPPERPEGAGPGFGGPPLS